MLLYPLALAAMSVSAQPATPMAPLGKFTDLPNIGVTFYDVSGKNVRQVHSSIEQKAPRDPASNRPIPAISDWSIKAAVKTSTTAGQCTLTDVKLDFAGNATMPRLVPLGDQPIPPALVRAWQQYVAQLEARQVAQLRFAYDRVGQIEREIRSSSCADWQKAASAAIARIKRDKAQARDMAPVPKLQIPEQEREEETENKEAL